MAQTSSAAREPSMEEILASIRRIIEDSDVVRQGVPEPQSTPAQRGEIAPFRRPLIDPLPQMTPAASKPQDKAAAPAIEQAAPIQSISDILSDTSFNNMSGNNMSGLRGMIEDQPSAIFGTAPAFNPLPVDEPKIADEEQDFGDDDDFVLDAHNDDRVETVNATPKRTEPAKNLDQSIEDDITKAIAELMASDLEAEADAVIDTGTVAAQVVAPQVTPSAFAPQVTPSAFAPQVAPSAFAPQVAPIAPEAVVSPSNDAIVQAPVEEAVSKSIVSDVTGRQVAAAFGDLSEVLRAEQRRSFDEMAQELLRPMLQDWLDNNLPTLVERLVREEIERVVRGERA